MTRRMRVALRGGLRMSLLIVVMGLAAAAFLYALGFPGADNFRSGNWVPGPAFFPQLLAIVLFVAAGT